MRLLRAEFHNFRLLRELELKFSSDPERRLTVVRAANATGKTTILTALQWALYGDSALPNKGSEYRLHPIDWDASVNRTVPISVTVDFEVVRYNKVGANLREARHRYRIIRSASEEITGDTSRRGSSHAKLFLLKETGAAPMDTPEAIINDELPPELREVFFTDGDRALSFIESGVALSTKRARVENAIRSLLGLGVIEDAINHVKRSAAEVNKHARQLGGGSELSETAATLESLTENLNQQTAELDDARQQFMSFDERLSETDRAITESLTKGNRDQLSRDLVKAKRAIETIDERIMAATKAHSALFKSEGLARDVLKPVLDSAFARLRELHDKGKIPNTTIPVLEERLATEVCICGESLGTNSEGGTKRRQYIERLIDESRHADEVQEIVTDLYYGSRSLQRGVAGDGAWSSAYREVVGAREDLGELRAQEGRNLKSLELQIDSVPATDVQGLREVQRQYSAQRDRFNARVASTETRIEGLKREREILEQKRDRLLRDQDRGERVIAELKVVGDVQDVLERAYNRITDEELVKVSVLMNSIFLEMIGEDPSQGAIIQETMINKEFDIIVLGPSGRHLNADRDLNGASRRALTLAFILALTKVSEVEAPNVIDTPLGMMSGFVKRSVLRTAIRESSQLVLFLTQAEISGCEDILDEYAGAVTTLTNPTHYPKMLLHDPGVKELRVLECACNHRQSCAVCERREDSAVLNEAGV
jgi:DNA sulfur modification protein DndD